jgi:hypothetical protein
MLQRVPKEMRKQIVHNQIKLIPRCNRETLRILVQHLTKVAENEKINKMSIKNIVLCIWGTSPYTPVFFTLLENHEYIFSDSAGLYNSGTPNNAYTHRKPTKSIASKKSPDADIESEGNLDWLKKEMEASPTGNERVGRGRPMTISFDTYRLVENSSQTVNLTNRKSQRDLCVGPMELAKNNEQAQSGEPATANTDDTVNKEPKKHKTAIANNGPNAEEATPAKSEPASNETTAVKNEQTANEVANTNNEQSVKEMAVSREKSTEIGDTASEQNSNIISTKKNEQATNEAASKSTEPFTANNQPAEEKIATADSKSITPNVTTNANSESTVNEAATAMNGLAVNEQAPTNNELTGNQTIITNNESTIEKKILSVSHESTGNEIPSITSESIRNVIPKENSKRNEEATVE